jgi:hypothetical protein
MSIDGKVCMEIYLELQLEHNTHKCNEQNTKAKEESPEICKKENPLKKPRPPHLSLSLSLSVSVCVFLVLFSSFIFLSLSHPSFSFSLFLLS